MYISVVSSSGIRYKVQDCYSRIGHFSNTLCCESTPEERCVENQHAAFRGSWRWATVSSDLVRRRATSFGDPMGEAARPPPILIDKRIPVLRIASAIGYGCYLLLFVLVALEIACRFGALPSDLYRLSQEVREANNQNYLGRLLILGDSMSVERPNSATYLLKRSMQKRGIGVVNLAVQGQGPQEYLERFVGFGTEVKANWVLLNYYVGNDLTDTLYSSSAEDGRRRAIKKWIAKSYLGDAMLNLWFRSTLRGYLAQARASPRQRTVFKDIQSMNPALVAAGRNHPESRLDNILMPNQSARFAWARNRTLLAEIHHQVQASGGQLLISVFPATEQINDAHFTFYKGLGFRTDKRFLTSRVPQDHMLAFCKSEGIICYDLLPAFRSRANERFYLDKDNHWNQRGHDLAFEQLEIFLGSIHGLGKRPGGAQGLEAKSMAPALPVGPGVEPELAR